MEPKPQPLTFGHIMNTTLRTTTKQPYRFGRWTRPIVLAIIATMKPRWKDFDPPIEEDVCAHIERDFSRFPLRAKIMILLMFQVIQWGGPLAMRLPVPFTWLSPDRRADRLRRLRNSKRQLPHLIFKALKTMVLIVCYSHPSIERYLGLVRPEWQLSRLRLREHLLNVDRQRTHLPPTPEPLGSAGTVEPHDMLQNNPALLPYEGK